MPSGVRVVKRAESSVPAGVLANGFPEAIRIELRPVAFRHMQFGITDLPQEVVREAMFAGRANQQVGIGETGGPQV